MNRNGGKVKYIYFKLYFNIKKYAKKISIDFVTICTFLFRKHSVIFFIVSYGTLNINQVVDIRYICLFKQTFILYVLTFSNNHLDNI